MRVVSGHAKIKAEGWQKSRLWMYLLPLQGLLYA